MQISVIERRVSATNQFDGTAGAASGTVTAVAGSDLTEGDRFFLNDGRGPEVTFVFTENRLLVSTRTLRYVVYGSGDTIAQVRDRLIVAINAAKALNLTAAVNGATDLTLLNRLGGTAGNLAPTADEVANAGFIVSVMAGGTDHLFTDLDGTRIYDEMAGGGQFDFPNLIPQAVDEVMGGGVLTVVIEHVMLSVPTASSYTLQAVTPEGDVVVLSSAAPPASGNIILGPYTVGGDDRIQVITAGATVAMTARVVAIPGLPLPPSAV